MSKLVNRQKQRGVVLLVHGLMLIATIATVGLAVDVGTIYLIKARLSAAVDAAALAAGRSVNLANTVQQAQAQATAAAQQFFNANFPAGYLNSIGTPTVTPTFTQVTDGNGNPTGVLNIAVTASAQAPTYFMNIFHISSITVSDSGTASRRGLVLMLVLDQSSSMNTAPDLISGLTACQAMKQAAQNFITLFSPYDYVGLVTFDITAHLVYAPSTNYGNGTLNADIGAIVCQSNTNTVSALEVAYQQIRTVNLPLAKNTIMLFTDGSPNGVSAQFPLRTQHDSRWGPALANPVPPVQAGATFGHNNSCSDVGPQDANNVNEEAICINMPAVCTAAGTVTGTLSQWGGQDSWGASSYGLAPPTDSDPTPTFPATCPGAAGASTNVRQFIAYIPNADVYGNSLLGFRSNWLFQTNQLCSPDPSVQPNCKNTGDFWANHPNVGSGNNFFPSAAIYTNANIYPNQLRPDQPNSIVAASMNGTVNEAFKIRSDTTYHPVINVVYLTGNGTDSVDRDFLPMVANNALIPALPYDPVAFVPYANPAFQADQEQGTYLVTADRNQLQSLFALLASEVLRLSQ
ncbi:MAG TPA: vWA domain-containing protein [Bryobacteraceae bacterium]|nr:vWA domain-containing protein [Bryobacteraceae bacterium]